MSKRKQNGRRGARSAAARPCREAAASYNTVQTSDGYSSAIFALVGSSCKARVLLDTRSLPPNPIRTKSFQPVA